MEMRFLLLQILAMLLMIQALIIAIKPEEERTMLFLLVHKEKLLEIS
jgi:hypothetical protein